MPSLNPFSPDKVLTEIILNTVYKHLFLQLLLTFDRFTFENLQIIMA